MKTYSEELKKKIVKLHIQDGRTIRSLATEYGIGHASISNWIKHYREECQTNDAAKSEYELMQEIQKLRQELAETKKENDFLKKAAAFFAKEID